MSIYLRMIMHTNQILNIKLEIKNFIRCLKTKMLLIQVQKLSLFVSFDNKQPRFLHHDNSLH
jgi:hypothetical protein